MCRTSEEYRLIVINKKRKRGNYYFLLVVVIFYFPSFLPFKLGFILLRTSNGFIWKELESNHPMDLPFLISNIHQISPAILCS